ncbi:MAG: hypothetical protein ACLFSW_05115 [Halobacteriales archaeon]
MRLFERLFSLIDGWGEGDVDVSPSSSVDMSALETISGGGGAPESVAGYELDMDSSINVRWEDEARTVECSHTGECWKTKVSDGKATAVVASHATREDAVEAAVEVMNGRVEAVRGSESDDHEEGVEENGTGKSEFEEEVESILADVDTESIEEVNEAFGD